MMKSIVCRLAKGVVARTGPSLSARRAIQQSKRGSVSTLRQQFASSCSKNSRFYSTEAPAAAPTDGSAPKPPLSKAEKERLRVEQARNSITVAKPKLSQVMKLEMLQNESAEKISEIWKVYHKEKYSVASVIPSGVYERVNSKLNEYPNFIIPLPKEQGAEFFWMQIQGNMMLFTRLIEYKVRKEQAKPALIIVHYTELAADKGIVLMRGEIDPAVLTPFEAQTLLNQAQAFYLDAKRLEIVKTFNKDPSHFDYEKILIDMPIQTRIADADADSANSPTAPNQ